MGSSHYRHFDGFHCPTCSCSIDFHYMIPHQVSGEIQTICHQFLMSHKTQRQLFLFTSKLLPLCFLPHQHQQYTNTIHNNCDNQPKPTTNISTNNILTAQAPSTWIFKLFHRQLVFQQQEHHPKLQTASNVLPNYQQRHLRNHKDSPPMD